MFRPKKALRSCFRLLLVCLVAGALSSMASAVTYEYDKLGRLTKVIYDDNTAIEYTYDASGNRTRKIITPG